ncbi:MAG: DNA double-strand break repair nuclease NurA [Candidatus Bathyarchaeia archaeon]
MNAKIMKDLADIREKLKTYVEKGKVVGSIELKGEPLIAVKPDPLKIKPLRKVTNYEGKFLAVDCSTRTLKRANNWGIYLMRPSHVLVKGRDIEWGYEERLYAAVGDIHVRRRLLEDYRLELESQMALRIMQEKFSSTHDGHTPCDYVLLDGGSYFGGERKFRVSLYDECKNRGVCLIAVSKSSPILHDEKGRDFIAAVSGLSPYPIWVYPSLKKPDKEEHLYGEISVIKLCQDSGRIFRCDVMEYLTTEDIANIISPLTFVSEDPRCLGYPIPLFLAHNFSRPSEAMLLHYHDEVENFLKEEGLLDLLRLEELACSFPDELHGAKYAFELEWIEHG